MKFSIFALFAFTLTGSALAQVPSLGAVSYTGNGCPAGSASVTLSPDQNTLRIIFSQFRVEVGQGPARVFERKQCYLNIPVVVPPGLSLAVSEVDYQGYNLLSSTGSSKAFVGIHLGQDPQGSESFRAFDGAVNSSYSESSVIASDALPESGCGHSTSLDILTDLHVKTSNFYQYSTASLGTPDTGGIVYHLNWRPCQ